jgi:hypothetical protein
MQELCFLLSNRKITVASPELQGIPQWRDPQQLDLGAGEQPQLEQAAPEGLLAADA